MVNHHGHCLCGACTWLHPGPQKAGLMCHCDECRRGVAGAFAAVQGYGPDDMSVTGPWKDYKHTPESSCGFCTICGTRFWFRSSLWSGDYYINVGFMTNAHQYTPDRHVMTDHKAPWVNIEDDIENQGSFSMPPPGTPDTKPQTDTGQDTMSGACLCGQVTWESDGDILWAGHCHCDTCRRACGAPFASFFGVARNSVTWTGQMTEFKSSDGQVSRKFCSVCGTHMTYENAIWPDETHLYAASLKNPDHFKPTAHYHYGERLSWVKLDTHLEKHQGSADA